MTKCAISANRWKWIQQNGLINDGQAASHAIVMLSATTFEQVNIAGKSKKFHIRVCNSSKIYASKLPLSTERNIFFLRLRRKKYFSTKKKVINISSPLLPMKGCGYVHKTSTSTLASSSRISNLLHLHTHQLPAVESTVAKSKKKKYNTHTHTGAWQQSSRKAWKSWSKSFYHPIDLEFWCVARSWKRSYWPNPSSKRQHHVTLCTKT